MEFEARLDLDTAAAARALGYPAGGLDSAAVALLRDAAAALAEAARPKWVWRRFALALPPHGSGGDGIALAGAPLVFLGRDIAGHLAGCGACLLLAVTLGDGVDRLLRAAQASDMARAVVLDAAASVLVEQYADEASRLLAARHAEDAAYLTPRFSPGYGDFPLETQAALLALLDAGRAVGLTVTGGGLMLPSKSITAVVGVAGRPVAGRLAGCGGCALRDSCTRRKEGNYCGQPEH